MTGRPPMPIGAHGKIKTAEVAPGVWEARTRVKDPDGELRKVKRQGRSGNAAENALKLALVDRRHNAGSPLTGATRIADVADRMLQRWRAAAASGDMGPRSVDAYEEALRLHILPFVGQLRLREATAYRLEEWLDALRGRRGAAVCKRARTVLSAVMGLAVRMGAILTNPVRELSPIAGASKRTRKPRAMTLDERLRWLEWLDTNVAHNPKTTRKKPRQEYRRETVIASRALGDITRFMFGTGVRIGEAMAVSWDDVDFTACTVAIRWHIVRVKGEGLQRRPGAKSEAGDRVLALPRWCVDMLMARRVDAHAGYPVFPDAFGGWRDPNLVMRWLAWSRDAAGFGWVTSHVFRQTVLTLLEADPGMSPREVADQAGHAKVRQTYEYLHRGVASVRAAEVLNDLLTPISEVSDP